MLFKAREDFNKVEETNNYFKVSAIDEIETIDGWKFAGAVVVGDQFKCEDTFITVNAISKTDNYYYFTCE